MTQNRELKRRIRLRMAATGEGYMQARRAVYPSPEPERREPQADGSTKDMSVDETTPMSVHPAPVWTPRAQVLLRSAESWAIRMRHAHVGTEHVLLALVEDQDGIGGHVLSGFAPTEDIRASVLKIMGSRGFYTASVMETDENGEVIVDEETGLPKQHDVDPAPPAASQG